MIKRLWPMGNFRWLALTLAALSLFTTAWACGPWFPWQVLGDRAAVLRAAPANSFMFELALALGQKQQEIGPRAGSPFGDQALGQDLMSNDSNIRTPAEHLRDIQKSGIEWRDPAKYASVEYESYRFLVERRGLVSDQITALASARAQRDGALAYEAAKGLPESVRLYLAGAVEFRSDHLDQAASYFQSAMNAPDRQRGVWAAFMLARCRRSSGDTKGAVDALHLARQFADHGDPDPLGLAEASFGDEARLSLDDARVFAALKLDDLIAQQKYGHAMGDALRIYGERAVKGSASDLDSVIITLEEILASPQTVRSGVTDPLVRRLLIAFTAARLSFDRGTNGAQNGAINLPAPRPGETFGVNSRLPVPGAQSSSVQEVFSVLDGIESLGGPAVDGADRLAALAYRAGRYDLAARAAKLSPGPISSWVLAKLALRAGDQAEATRRYAEASSAFPAHLADLASGSVEKGNLDSDNRELLEAEQSILALSRQEYVQAMELLYPAAASFYWGDVAYIAERVLTTDELRRFVDGHVPTSHPDAQGKFNDPQDETAFKLRWLLARRLFRDGQYDSAIGYFPTSRSADDIDPRTDPTVLTEVQTEARDYAQALSEAKSIWPFGTHAEALFRAAELAEKHGMELMGTEGPPDFRVEAGNYDEVPFGAFNSRIDTQSGKWFYKPSPQISPAERQRLDASVANPDERFHYRSIAMKFAEQAADLLPPRSQAFAAVLCRASSWRGFDDSIKLKLYNR